MKKETEEENYYSPYIIIHHISNLLVEKYNLKDVKALQTSSKNGTLVKIRIFIAKYTQDTFKIHPKDNAIFFNRNRVTFLPKRLDSYLESSIKIKQEYESIKEYLNESRDIF